MMAKGKVDCRSCAFFVRLEDLDEETREKIMYQRGRKALGYCRLHEIPIVYYKGYCSHYMKKPEKIEPLSKYLKIEWRTPAKVI